MKYYAVYKPHFENNPKETWSFLSLHKDDTLGHSPRNIYNNLLSGESRAELLFKMNNHQMALGIRVDPTLYVLLPEDEVFP
jgi:hypothetical protein